MLSCSRGQDWQLPVRLGDSRDSVRAKLGERKPCGPGSLSETCDCFPNSGMCIGYDNGRVEGITLGGGVADRDSIPFESRIVYGITIRDQLQELKVKLGEPNVIDPGPPPRYKWRRAPWMIEVVIGSDRDGEQRNKILWVTITNAVG